MRNFKRKVISLLFGLMVGGYQFAGASLSTANGRNALAPPTAPNANEQVMAFEKMFFAPEAQRILAGDEIAGASALKMLPALKGRQTMLLSCAPSGRGRLINAIPAISSPANIRCASGAISAKYFLEIYTFPHKGKKHSELNCAQCHTVTSDKVEVKEFPTHAACVSCHNFAADMMAHADVFCGVCHESNPISKSEPALFQFPKPRSSSDFGYNFSHVSHLKPQSVGVVCAGAGDRQAYGNQPQCADCHKKTEPVGKSAPEMTIETGHAACFKCHCEDPKIRPAMPGMQDCAKCHQIDGPQSPRLFNIVAAFRHGDHELDTRPRRKADLRKDRPGDYLCVECHQAVVAAESLKGIKLPEVAHCNQCHNGKPGLPDELAKDVVESLKSR